MLIQTSSTIPYVKLPSLHVFSSLLVSYDNHKLRDLAADHPLIKLRHDLFNICPNLIIGRDCRSISNVVNAGSGLVYTKHIKSIFLYTKYTNYKLEDTRYVKPTVKSLPLDRHRAEI